MLKLPKPSKMKRREMGKVKRADAVNNARRVGRADAIKKRYVKLWPVPLKAARWFVILIVLTGT